MCRYPITASAAYGPKRKGCFEPPHPETPPSSGLKCEDLIPIEFESPLKPTNDEAMDDMNQLVSLRYCICKSCVSVH